MSKYDVRVSTFRFSYSAQMVVMILLEARSSKLEAVTALTLDNIDCQTTTGSFLVFGFHIVAGIPHGFNHLVQ